MKSLYLITYKMCLSAAMSHCLCRIATDEVLNVGYHKRLYAWQRHVVQWEKHS